MKEIDTAFSVNPLFSDGMVLQQGRPVPVFGTARPGAEVVVSVQGYEAAGTADDDGKWTVMLPALAVSEQETMTVRCADEVRMIRDAAVGEVWIGGGQSNMEFWMHYEKHIDEVRPVCTNPMVRYYDVPEVFCEGQRSVTDYSEMGRWRKADPENIDWFSAVSYYFASALQQSMGVPVGVIGLSVGGTTAQAWMRKESVDEIGRPWAEDHRQLFDGIDMEQYWKRQEQYLAKEDKGHPFRNPFNNKFLPVTICAGEAMQYIIESVQNGSMDMEMQMRGAEQFPGSLYENMVLQAAPYAVKGVLWYQGESDEKHADIYSIMLSRLIMDWRELWKEELPFLLVQLSGYESWMGGRQTRYNELRRAQQAVADTVRGVCLTSISDAGEQYDIHPKDKKTPGERLCLLARQVIYHEDVCGLPPTAVSAARSEQTIRTAFRNAEGLHIEGDKLRALDVYTIENGSLDCIARVEGAELVIEMTGGADLPEEDIHVSFATQLFYTVNLYNAGHVPAVPFEFTV